MSAVALSYKTLEKDPSATESVLIECSACDPDNPRAVPREDCKRCRGSGKVHPDIALVVSEIHSSKLKLLLGEDDD